MHSLVAHTNKFFILKVPVEQFTTLAIMPVWEIHKVCTEEISQ
jgi:glutathione peroxidase-family protein